MQSQRQAQPFPVVSHVVKFTLYLEKIVDVCSKKYTPQQLLVDNPHTLYIIVKYYENNNMKLSKEQTHRTNHI